MHCSSHLHPVPHGQVQSGGEEKTFEKNEPLEPVKRPLSQGLSMGWNFGFKMVLLCQAEGFGVCADVHSDLSHGCSPCYRLVG